MGRSGQREGRAGGAGRPRWVHAPASRVVRGAADGGGREGAAGRGAPPFPPSLRRVREGLRGWRGRRCCSILIPSPRSLAGTGHNLTLAPLRGRAKRRALGSITALHARTASVRPAGRSAAFPAARSCTPG